MSGKLPTEMPDLVGLERLMLHDNDLSGNFPPTNTEFATSLTSLNFVSIYNNNNLTIVTDETEVLCSTMKNENDGGGIIQLDCATADINGDSSTTTDTCECCQCF